MDKLAGRIYLAMSAEMRGDFHAALKDIESAFALEGFTPDHPYYENLRARRDRLLPLVGFTELKIPSASPVHTEFEEGETDAVIVPASLMHEGMEELDDPLHPTIA